MKSKKTWVGILGALLLVGSLVYGDGTTNPELRAAKVKNGSGSVVINSTGVMTMPNHTDTVAGLTDVISGANNLTVTDDNATNATMYPVWMTTTSGTNPGFVSSTGFTWNPSTATLACTNFSGALSGNASTATTATNATNVATTATNSTNATFYPTFVASSTSGNQGEKTATGLTWNPSTNTLATTTFSGALSGNSTTATALASIPTACGANTYANSIAASGNLSCASITNASTTGASAANASTLGLRDANADWAINRSALGYTTTATAAGTTTLAASASRIQYFTGTTTQTVKMPATNASGMFTGSGISDQFEIHNTSTGALALKDSSGGAITTEAAASTCFITALTSASPGAWDYACFANGASGGTVTSVQVAGANGLSFSGGPITTSGTITATLTAPNIQQMTFDSATFTGEVTSTSATVTNISSFTGLYVGMGLSASADVTAGSYIVSMNTGASTLVISAAATGGSATTVTFTPYNSGSGYVSGTYTTPANALYIDVICAGPGGQGSGGGTNAAKGTAGSAGQAATTFGTSSISAGPGGGGQNANACTSGSNTTTMTNGTVVWNIVGSLGEAANANTTTAGGLPGGMGGDTPLGLGFGGPGGDGGDGVGAFTPTGYGAGGGGGGTTANATLSNAGGGGCSGGVIEEIITSPAATYAFNIGAGGSAAGGAGTSGQAGAAGGNGVCTVKAFFQ